MILSLLLFVTEPALAEGDQEMFQPQCEFTRALNNLDSPVVAEEPPNVEKSK